MEKSVRHVFSSKKHPYGCFLVYIAWDTIRGKEAQKGAHYEVLYSERTLIFLFFYSIIKEYIYENSSNNEKNQPCFCES